MERLEKEFAVRTKKLEVVMNFTAGATSNMLRVRRKSTIHLNKTKLLRMEKRRRKKRSWSTERSRQNQQLLRGGVRELQIRKSRYRSRRPKSKLRGMKS
jgi:hypothetical protein